MKKSTILLLVVVYILSFFLVGLLGHSLRNYNPTYYPEQILLEATDDKTTTHQDVEGYDYYFTHRKYVPGSSIRIKAVVKPDNVAAEYKYVIFFKDESNKTFSLATHATNPDTIEENFAAITLLASLSDTQVKTTTFYVRSTDPSSSITLKVCIAFALF